MAQAATARKISPSKVVTIEADGTVDHPIVTIPNHGILEFKSKSDAAWEIVLLDPDGGDTYPLSIPVTAHGNAYFVGHIETLEDAVEYTIVALFSSDKTKKPARPLGNNQIIIGGGGVPGPKRRK